MRFSVALILVLVLILLGSIFYWQNLANLHKLATVPQPSDQPLQLPADQIASSSANLQPTVSVVAVGDIACDSDQASPAQCQQLKTAELAETLKPDAVLLLGDLQYDTGLLKDFQKYYQASWGRFNPIAHPVPGNHEYSSNAQGYFEYFGASAGPKDLGYYSFNLGDWHIIALNSNCFAVSCNKGSVQERWLQEDLQKNTKKCTLAYWHHPLVSSGLHGGYQPVQPLWDDLLAAHAEIVLAGHDHHYERFAAQDGLRQFIVGTGGRNLYPVGSAQTGSEVRKGSIFGVLNLKLSQDNYQWQFISTDNQILDAGDGICT